MRVKIPLILLFTFTSALTFSQQRIISGRVIDQATHEPIPYVSVFINNTTIGAATNDNGEFVLKEIPHLEVVEVIISFVGYERKSLNIRLTDGEVKLGEIQMIPALTELKAVEVTASRDKAWEKNLRKFKKAFLGSGKLADKCSILNQWVIDFSEADKRSFKAFASEPIEIENKATGYKITCLLNNFLLTNKDYLIAGSFKFEELRSSSESEKAEWKSNRQKAYLQSKQFLFKSIIDHKISGAGFDLYTEAPGYENSTTRSDIFFSELGKSVIPIDTTDIVENTSKEGVYKIKLKGRRVEIHDRKELIRNGIYKDVPYPVSWLWWLNKSYLLVNKDGLELNPSEVYFAGAMSNSRVAEMLPINYKPEKPTFSKFKKKDQLVSEKIYVQMDRPYYYPGEVIWFKGYLQYPSIASRDSLSQTVHTEIIDNQQRKIVFSKTLRIENGTFTGDFTLPDSIHSGEYYLRAYTSWNRNYGDENLYTKPFLILKNNESVVNQQKEASVAEDSVIFLRTDKSRYQRNEKITLTIQVNAQSGKPISSNLSMAVTDTTQVIPLNLSGSIIKDFSATNDQHKLKTRSYPIERGLTFSGRVFIKGRPQKANVNIVQFLPRNVYSAESNNKGVFRFEGPVFYDSCDFIIQNSNKNVAVEKIEMLDAFSEPEIKSITIPKVKIAGGKSTHIAQSSGSRSGKMLKEVVVKERRNELQRKDYEKANYSISGKDLNASYGNLLLTLSGKFPGLVVRQMTPPGEATRWVVYVERGANSSMQSPQEVLVILNDVPSAGTPADIIGTLDPQTIKTIALKTALSPLNGSYGGFGVLYIYTGLPTQTVTKKNQNSVRLYGYSRPAIFTHPDSVKNNSVRQPLIFWKPNIQADDKGIASVSFTATKAGIYRVIVEGVTEAGDPVKDECLVEVKKP